MLEHRQHQQVLEEHHAEPGPLQELLRRSPLEGARTLRHLEVARSVARLWDLRLRPIVVLGRDGADAATAVAGVEQERGVEVAEAVQVQRVEAAGRVHEPDVGHRARRVPPPSVHGAVGLPVVDREVAEQVHGERRVPEQVGPKSLVIEALVRLSGRRTNPCRCQGSRRDEVRSGVRRVLERHPASGRTSPRSLPRDDRLRADGVSVRLTPPGLVVARAPTERRHLRAARHVVVVLPAVRGLELFSRDVLSHSQCA